MPAVKKNHSFNSALAELEKTAPFSNLLSAGKNGDIFRCIGGNKTLALFQTIALYKLPKQKYIFIFSSFEDFEECALFFSDIYINQDTLSFFSLGGGDPIGLSTHSGIENFVDAQNILVGNVNNFYTTELDYDYLTRLVPGRHNSITIEVGKRVLPKQLERALIRLGYSREYQTFEHKEFSIRGCILDFFPEISAHPIRIEFEGDKVESIRTFSVVDQLSISALKNYVLQLPPHDGEKESSELSFIKFFNYTPVYINCNSWDLAINTKDNSVKNIIDFCSICWFSKNPHPKIKSSSHNSFLISMGREFPSFTLKCADITIRTNRRNWVPAISKKTQKQKGVLDKDFLENLKLNDPVLHKHHGIGLFRGLESIHRKSGHITENVVIEYYDGAVIYVPVDRLGLLYPSPMGRYLKIDSLTKNTWKRKIRSAGAGAGDLAKTIVDLYSFRNKSKNRIYKTSEEYEKEISKSFPYQLTDGQTRAIKDIKTDLLSPFPMNRLLVGDVGFGKTEIMIRSVVFAVTSGYQAVVLAPTTLLSDQHFFAFKSRLEPLGIRVGLLSRFVSKERRKETLRTFSIKHIDVIIGTHSILSADLLTDNIGIIIVDEEHRFGVKQKDKLLVRYPMVDFLTISATPLPRTLQKSLNGFISASTLPEPPPGRLPVSTYIKYFDYDWFARAIQKEIDFGGQAIVVQNKINLLPKYKRIIEEKVNGSKVDIIHGRISSKTLEASFLRFFSGETNVLCGTTIVESGLDIPNVNTIIICDAQRFGLAQLHQLRGRVGRSTIKANCYLAVPKSSQLSSGAKFRLKSINENWMIGSGFAISQKDLEIRGPGEIFGAKQSGNIQNIGYSLFVDLLEEALGKKNHKPDVVVQTMGAQSIPPYYIQEDSVRLGFYSRIVSAHTIEMLGSTKKDIIDRFGNVPDETKTLFAGNEIRIVMRNMDIKKITILDKNISFHSDKNTIKKLLNYFNNHPGTAHIIEDGEERIIIVPIRSSVKNNTRLAVVLGEHLKKLKSFY